jgi:VIT1/CCC1 family predicted Fe2+/Mn2+ transporter
MLSSTFIRRHLEPSDRIGETLFGLIMALGFTGAVRLGMDETTSRELLVAILGCNIAWGIVDGVMYVMLAQFDRGRGARIARAVRESDDAAAIAAIDGELADPFGVTTTEDERRTVCRILVAGIRRSDPPRGGLRSDDVLGGVAVALLITIMTVPIVVPFAFIDDAWIASRVSNGIALAMLFVLGMRWGSFTGARPWATGLAMVAIGLVLVGVTLALGG